MDPVADCVTKTSLLRRLCELRKNIRENLKHCNVNLKTQIKIKKKLIKSFKVIEKLDLEERLKFYVRVTKNAQKERDWKVERQQLFAIQKSSIKLTRQVKNIKLNSA